MRFYFVRWQRNLPIERNNSDNSYVSTVLDESLSYSSNLFCNTQHQRQTETVHSNNTIINLLQIRKSLHEVATTILATFFLKLQGTPYHSPNLHSIQCSSAGMRWLWWGRDRQTNRRLWPTYTSPWLFNGFRVLAALINGTPVVGVSQTLRRWTESATYIRQGGHHAGHWPTFQLLNFCTSAVRWSANISQDCP